MRARWLTAKDTPDVLWRLANQRTAADERLRKAISLGDRGTTPFVLRELRRRPPQRRYAHQIRQLRLMRYARPSTIFVVRPERRQAARENKYERKPPDHVSDSRHRNVRLFGTRTTLVGLSNTQLAAGRRFEARRAGAAEISAQVRLTRSSSRSCRERTHGA